MNDPCEVWQDDISAYLDGALPLVDEQRVHAHLRACAACSEALVDLVPLVQAMRQAPLAEPARDLWPRISAELRHDPLFQRFSLRGAVRRQRFSLPRGLGWAAAVVVVAIGGATVAGHSVQPTPRIADVDTYWHQHAIESQELGVPGLYAPSLHAVESSYDLDP